MSQEAGESFYVGGRYVTDAVGQHQMVDQMHVRRYPAARAGDRLPVVLLHGGAQTGAHWEGTPDGRPGFAQLLTEGGRDVYVVDLPGVGRSRYLPEEQGPLAQYSTELIELAFTDVATHGDWPAAKRHTRWPGTGRRGDPVFDTFYASQVGAFAATPATETRVREAGAALIGRIGRCHVLTHSQAGPYGWHLADAQPGLVASLVALEPQGPPFRDPGAADPAAPPRRPYGLTTAPLTYDPPLAAGASGLPEGDFSITDPAVHSPDAVGLPTLIHLAGVPVMIITAEASYHATYDHLTADFLRQHGVATEHVRLEEHGITGNGHLMAVETNNHEVAAFVAGWLDRHDTHPAQPTASETQPLPHIPEQPGVLS